MERKNDPYSIQRNYFQHTVDLENRTKLNLSIVGDTACVTHL